MIRAPTPDAIHFPTNLEGHLVGVSRSTWGKASSQDFAARVHYSLNDLRQLFVKMLTDNLLLNE
jgi:hypothetical protein